MVAWLEKHLSIISSTEDVFKEHSSYLMVKKLPLVSHLSAKNLRQTARAVILNKKNQVLLLKINDKPLQSNKRNENSSFWVTVGGEIEPGESPEEALRRELREEVGIQAPPTVELLAFGEQILPWKKLRTQFIEIFFVIQAETINLDARDLTPEEMKVISEYRWWSIDEMLATNEVIFPHCLAQLVADYIRSEKWVASQITLNDNP